MNATNSKVKTSLQTPKITVMRISQKGRSLVDKFKRPLSAQDRQMRRACMGHATGKVQHPRHAGKILQPSRWGPKGTRKQVTRKDSESKMDSDISATSLISRAQRSEASRVLRGASCQPSFPLPKKTLRQACRSVVTFQTHRDSKSNFLASVPKQLPVGDSAKTDA